MRLVEPWKVSELVVPMERIKDEEDEEADLPEDNASHEKPKSGASEKKITEEERRVSILPRNIVQISGCPRCFACAWKLTISLA